MDPRCDGSSSLRALRQRPREKGWRIAGLLRQQASRPLRLQPSRPLNNVYTRAVCCVALPVSPLAGLFHLSNGAVHAFLRPSVLHVTAVTEETNMAREVWME
jgi:hypothetical protein